MVIYTKGFEKKYNDTIAVIYELNTTVNKDGSVTTSKRPVKINHFLQRYVLDPFKEYWIICGLSEYHVKGKEIKTTFLSEKHRFFKGE